MHASLVGWPHSSLEQGGAVHGSRRRRGVGTLSLVHPAYNRRKAPKTGLHVCLNVHPPELKTGVNGVPA